MARIGHAQSTSLFAMQLGQPKSPEDGAVARTERRERLDILFKISELMGAVLVSVGGLGSYLFQL